MALVAVVALEVVVLTQREVEARKIKALQGVLTEVEVEVLPRRVTLTARQRVEMDLSHQLLAHLYLELVAVAVVAVLVVLVAVLMAIVVAV
jgi:hypothetical protein